MPHNQCHHTQWDMLETPPTLNAPPALTDPHSTTHTACPLPTPWVIPPLPHPSLVTPHPCHDRTRLPILGHPAPRDGTKRQIFARDLVPGDVVYVDVGDKVPADCRVVRNLTVVVRADSWNHSLILM